MIVGEGPGRSEDVEGRPFVGRAGKNLERLLQLAGMSRQDVFITNVVKCRPPGNRKPSKHESDTCYRYLRRQMDLVDPEVVVLLGDSALKLFFPEAQLAEAHGRPAERGGRTYFPTYHPASIIYNKSLRQVLDGDFTALGSLLGILSG